MRWVAVALALLLCPGAALSRSTDASVDAGAGERVAAADAVSATDEDIEPTVDEAPDESKDRPGPVLGACSAAGAVWSADERPLDLRAAPVRKALNTEAAIWTCKVAGRQLVVKHQLDLRGYFACSATELGSVSAWVDGVKVVRSEPIGEFQLCMGGGRDEGIEPIVLSITLERSGVLTVCRLTGTAEKAKRVCGPVGYGGPVDATYVSPGQVTPPALELRIDAAPICASLTGWLSRPGAVRDTDESLDRFWVEGTWYWGKRDHDTAPEPALFDIDNDGRPDEVTLVRSMRMHGMEWGQIAWRPKGSTGEPFTAGVLPDNDEVSWDRFSAYSVQPVRIEGRSYVYVRRRYMESGPGQDLDTSANRPRLITRGLLALHPDGEATTLCGWGPKVRPEEVL